jgi:hypothetical protein
MDDREMLKEWVVEALTNLKGSAHLIDVLKEVWKLHSAEIEKAGDLFYRWQYDIRWAADYLRREGRMRSADETPRGTWELV